MVLAWSTKDFSDRGYVAPTVYLMANKDIGGYNYYKTLNDAAAKSLYLQNKPGGKNISAIGSLTFIRNKSSAQTAGINCDFFLADTNSITPISYADLKTIKANYIIARFYKTDGTGPYYGAFQTLTFGFSATVIDDYPADKIKALDEYHRQVQLIKANHNALAIFLDDLSKKQLTAKEQQIFNAGILRLQNLREEIKSLPQLQIVSDSSGKINGVGIIPLIIWVAVIVLAGIIALGVTDIVKNAQKAKMINDNYNHNQWLVEQYKTADPDTRKVIEKSIDATNKAQQDLSKQSTSSLGEIGNVVKWGLIALIVIKAMDFIPKRRAA